MPRELYGRSEESKIITDMLDSAGKGTGAVALVEGIIGTGKTSLLRWAEETARERGMLALSATATATEQRFPLGIVHQLLSRLPEAADDADGWTRALSPADPDYPLLAGLCACVSRAARRTPLLLTVDGIHHADPQSLLWLGFLSRRLESLPLVLLASKRCGEPASDRHLLVEFMEGVRPDRHIHLHDLSPSAALDLAAALGGRGPGSVDALIAGSGGNPYLLTEQIRTAPGLGGPHPRPAGNEGPAGGTGTAVRTGRAGVTEVAGGPGTAGSPGLTGRPVGTAEATGHPWGAVGPGTAGSTLYPGATAGPGAAASPAGARSPYGWEAVGRTPDPYADRLDERLRLQAVKERVLCMLRRLDPHGLRVARAVSILGAPVDAALLADLCGLSAEDLCRCLTRLTESGLLRSADLTFRHPVLAGLLYQDVPCAERAELHRLAARCLRHRGGPPEETAHHLLRAHRLDEPWMVRMLLDAARRTVARDPATARRLVEKAVLHGIPQELAPHAEDLRIQALAGLDLPASAHALTMHAALATGRGERARQALRLADTLLRLDQPARARQTLEQARREIGPQPAGSATATHLRHALTHVRLHEGTYRPAPGDEDRLDAVLLLRTGTGDRAAAVRRIARRVLAAPRVPYGSPCWYHALLGLLWAGDADEARRHLDTEVGLARTEGAAPRTAEALAVRGLVHLHLGVPAAAEEDAGQALDRLGRIGADHCHAGALARSVLIDAALERDDMAGACALLDTAPPLPGDQPLTWWRLHLLLSAGRALGRLGQAQRGLAVLAHCEQELTRRGVTNPAVLPWRSTRSALHLALGDPGTARRLARREVELARRWAAPHALARALVALADASSGREALHAADRAVELLEGGAAPLLFAHALCAAGRAHRQGGNTGRARELLRRANEVGISLGADGLVEAVQRELREAGGRPDPRKASTESLLTPTERQVSELASRGMSNRSIAGLLKVSLRNVESHLTHSYRKLRISGRHELTRFFPPDEDYAADPLHLRARAVAPLPRLRTG
ncbi:BREX system ATP-binding domain-containing protein [Streptomyces sp. CC77]|uniref:BREX system ATP-binding domain-containing protein n=1 Tax=Streptomyces sp. CC77 TaxID=1906739 RepID=UPI0008DD8B52|nr:LuxR family transcriptional regulator [Streptomyces sp. CC77]OII68225.1 hypothetical protein BJP39_21945 [Streptomyces sp. CC77]